MFEKSFLPQPGVLVDEPPVLGRHEPPHLHRLADHRGHDAEELRRSFVVPPGVELEADAQRTDRLPVDGNREAQEAAFLAGAEPDAQLLRERRLDAEARDDDLPASRPWHA
jgi:hypothetical protein